MQFVDASIPVVEPLVRAAELKRLNQKIFGPLLRDSEKNLSLYFEAKPVSDSGLTRSDIEDRIRKIYNCSSIVELRAIYKPDSEGVEEQHLKIHNANYCQQHLICPICAKRVQTIRKLRYEKPIKEMVKSHTYGYFLTFTVNDGENLGERIGHLKDSVRTWFRMGQKRRKYRTVDGKRVWSGEYFRSDCESRKIEAGLMATEVKRGENSELWHVHGHGIFFSNEPLDYRLYDSVKKQELEKKYGAGNIPEDELDNITIRTVRFRGEERACSKFNAEWLQATGDSMGLDVVPIYHPGMKRKPTEEHIWKTCEELLKYPVKQNPNQDYSDTLQIITHCYGHRFFSTYGKMRSFAGNDFTDQQTAGSKEIFTVIWKGHQYGKMQGQRCGIENQDITDVKREVLGMQAKILGSYRRERKRIISQIDSSSAEGVLDEEKCRFRERVRELWGKYRHKLYAALEERMKKELPPSPPPDPVIEQLSLSF